MHLLRTHHPTSTAAQKDEDVAAASARPSRSHLEIIDAAAFLLHDGAPDPDEGARALLDEACPPCRADGCGTSNRWSVKLSGLSWRMA